MIKNSKDNDFKPILVILEKHIAEIFIKIAFNECIQVNHGDVLNYFIYSKTIKKENNYNEDGEEIIIDYNKLYKNLFDDDEYYVHYYNIYKCPSLEKLYKFIANIPHNRLLKYSEIIHNFNIENTDFLKSNYIKLSLIFRLLEHKYDKNYLHEDIKLDLRYYIDNYYSHNNDYNMIYKYFFCIDFYIKKQYNIYSLGDSLYRFNNFWNSINEITINIIPLSGNIRRNINEKTFNELIINNTNFGNLIQKLKNNEKCIITDYFYAGNSVKSLIILLINLKIPVTNLYFLFITDDIFKKLDRVVEVNDEEFPVYISLTKFNQKEITGYNNYFNETTGYNNYFLVLSGDINLYYQYSEDYESRCVPKYINLGSKINDIYYDKNLKNNYYNCNVHTLLFYFFLIKFYNNFYIKHKLETSQDYLSHYINYFLENDIIEISADQYISIKNYFHSEDSIEKSRNSNKYLKYKYKYKYLKLKNMK